MQRKLLQGEGSCPAAQLSTRGILLLIQNEKSICSPFSNSVISTSFSSPFSTLTWFSCPAWFLIWIWPLGEQTVKTLHLRSFILCRPYPSLLLQLPKKQHSLKGIKCALSNLALEANHLCAHEGDAFQCCHCLQYRDWQIESPCYQI